MPPANAFWSITMYDKEGFQIPNPINRFAIGSHDKLTSNADGSLDIYVQANSPAKDKEANWLPAPKGFFQPTMRIYSPRAEVLDGTWAPPPFKKVTEGSNVSAEEAREIALETYIYAYPLVLMHVTRQVGTNVPESVGLRAPINQLAHAREFPDPSFTDVVCPNADTLYSALTYDVSKEPLVVSVPDSGGRYYLLPWLDYWTDVFTVPGKRTTGTGAQTFAIVGPNWHGSLPTGIEGYNSPTGSGLLIGRTQTNGKADYEAVRGFQDGMKAVPLSAYGKPYKPPKNTVNPNQDMSGRPIRSTRWTGRPSSPRLRS